MQLYNWMVTWNYDYIPFNHHLLLTTQKQFLLDKRLIKICGAERFGKECRIKDQLALAA